MVDLEKGKFVKWINPSTGGWETGNIMEVANGVGALREKVLFDTFSGLEMRHDDIGVLVEKTYGGLCVVPLSWVEPIPKRRVYEAEEVKGA